MTLRKQQLLWWLLHIAAICSLTLGTVRCAKEVAPSGGPKDTIAPKVIRTKPINQSVNFKSRRIVLFFNEFVDLNKPEVNLLISPPLATKPQIWKNGKKLVIQIPDSLLTPDKTYSISFNKAIKDVNEGNMLDNYVYAFSTGSVIDSLRVKGSVQYAFDQKAAASVFVMLYRDSSDKAPRKTLPDYITRCNKDGNFEITNIAQGSYRLFALRDTNSNYKFDQPNEQIGYSELLVTPTAIRTVQTDTIHRDSLVKKKMSGAKIVYDTIHRDTIITKTITKFSPDTLHMQLFEEQSVMQFIDQNTRERKEKIVFAFKKPLYNDTIRIVPLDSTIAASRLFIEKNKTRDTVVCWLKDTTLRNNDTLKLLVHYIAPDSTETNVWKTDTIRPRYEARKDKFKGRLLLKSAFSVKNNASINFGEALYLQTTTPILSFSPDSIVVEQVTDTSALQKTNGEFYKIDTTKNEIVDQQVLPPAAGAPLDDETIEQKVASYRLGRSKFTLTFARPVQNVTITLAEKTEVTDWLQTEIDAPSKTILCWLKNKDLFKTIKPKIKVQFKNGKRDTTVTIDLSKRIKGQKRTQNKTLQARLTLSLNKKQEQALPIDHCLLLTASNPIVSFDTSKIKIIKLPDSSRVSLTKNMNISINSARQLCVFGAWKKSSSYVVQLKDSAFIDIWGLASKETELEFKTETLHNCYISKPVKAKVQRDSSKLTMFSINSQWEEKLRYRVTIKRGTFLDLYGKRNDTTQLLFSVPAKDTYGTLTLRVQGVTQPTLIQLMPKEKQVVPIKEVLIFKDSVVKWQYLNPGEYPVKAVIDVNKNKKWDAGNFKHRRQAEAILFSPKNMTIKAKWESKETWDLNDKTAPAKDTLPKGIKLPNMPKK